MRNRSVSRQRTPATRLRHGVLGLTALAFSVAASASELTPFRIGTGGSAGTYFPIGSLMAEAISKEMADVQEGDSKWVMLAQRSNGSKANVRDIGQGLLESGFVQADVAHWAHHGTGPFVELQRVDGISAIASLYLESVHLLARAGSGIKSVQDLAGKRVSIDEIGSGTQVDVGTILNAFSLSESDVSAVYLKTADAIGRLRNNELDAFFIIAGYPVSGIAELLENETATLVTIDGPGVDSLLKDHPFFTRSIVPAGTYAKTFEVSTVAVAAQWLVNTRVDQDLVYELTKALWSERAQQILVQGHPKGRELKLDTALLGISIPLHPGAERFYIEAGMTLPDSLSKTESSQ